MLLLKNISKQYSGQVILDDVTMSVGKHVTALVGKNGSGKSTLMKIVAGLEYSDSGEIITQKNAQIEYLPQEAVYDFSGTVWEEVKSWQLVDNVSDLTELHDKLLAQLEADPNEKDFIRLNEVNEKLHRIEVKNRKDNSVETILLNLGFTRDLWDKPAKTLSGGWQMRVALARVLVREPDIILLDEPTNYLDIVTIDFLADWLEHFDGHVLLVSHDRDFLNAVSEETWEIANGRVSLFRGNYSFYLSERDQRINLLAKQREKQLEEMRQLQDYYDKNHTNAAHAAMAQSKMKQLEQIKSELIELPRVAPKMNFRLPEPKRGGDIVVELDNISKNFGGPDILRNYKRIIRRGEKIALVGRNGFGKSTLMNIIGGELEPTGGVCRIGTGIEICYFRQHEISTLPPDETVLGYIESRTPFEMMSRVKNLLSCFLFFEEDWDKKIAVLSGGEKVRLAFINFILSPGNLLLLDEPTTHLDIDSKDILLSTLKDIPATIVFVSHDSHFVNSLATSIVYFRGRGDAVNFPGNYDEYLQMYGHEIIRDEKTAEKGEKPAEKSEGKLNFAQQKELRNLQNRLKREVEQLLNEIDSKEKEKEAVAEKINSDPMNSGLAKRFVELDNAILELLEQWEQKSSELEKITSDGV